MNNSFYAPKTKRDSVTRVTPRILYFFNFVENVQF